MLCLIHEEKRNFNGYPNLQLTWQSCQKSAENFPSSLGFTSLSLSLLSSETIEPDCGATDSVWKFPGFSKKIREFWSVECLKTTSAKVLGDRGDQDRILRFSW